MKKTLLLLFTAITIFTTAFAQGYTTPPEWDVEVMPNPGFTQTPLGYWVIATDLILAIDVIIPVKITVSNPSVNSINVNTSKVVISLSSIGLEYDASLTTDFSISGVTATSDNIVLAPGDSEVLWCYMTVTQGQCGLDPAFAVYWQDFDTHPGVSYMAYPNFMSFNTLQVMPQSTSPECGEPTGSIDLNIDGGIPPMTITWNNALTTETLENLGYGNYDYTVQDAYGCEETGSIIFEPTIEIKSHAISSTDCGVDNGTAYVNWVEGTAPFLIELIDHNWQVVDDATVTGSGPEYDHLFTGLPAGLYTFRLTDANGNCNFYRLYNEEIYWEEVEPSNNLDFTYQVTDPTCCYNTNGSIEVTGILNSPPTGIQYLWSTSDVSNQISQLSAGEYIVTVTDTDGCEKVKVLTLSCPEQGTLTVTPVHPDCNLNLGSIVLDYSSASWSYVVTGPSGTFANSAIGPVTITNLNNGTYTIDITAGGCTYSYEQELSVLDVFDFDLQINECGPYNAGLLECNIIGGAPTFEFYWEWNGIPYSYAQNNYMISDGTYCVTVTDGNTCTVSHCETYTTPSELLSITLDAVHPTCSSPENGELSVTAVNGVSPYTYQWSNGVSTFNNSGLESGITYEVTVTDDYGCAEKEEFLLNDYDYMYLNSEVTDTYCGASNGSIDITVISGVTPYTFSWSHGPITEDVFGLGLGEYTVTVTDNTGCQVTETFSLRGSLDLTWDVVGCGCDGNPSTPNPLQNGSIDLTVNNGVAPYTFSWSNSATTEDIFGCEDEITYSVNVSDNAGCPGYAEIIMGSDQSIALDAGWNLISTYIDPFNNVLEDILEESDLKPFIWSFKNDLQDVNDYYLSTYSIIQEFGIGEGYYVKMEQAGNLELFGSLLCPEDNPINITYPTAPIEEWIAYLRTTNQPIVDAMSSITGDIMVVKEDEGLIWWPAFGLNNIGDMEPGEGYNVIISNINGVTLTYDVNSGYNGTKHASLPNVNYLKLNNKENLNTGNTMLLGIPENAWNTIPAIGDEIGIYTCNGVLIGRNIFKGGHTGVVIYGNDETNQNQYSIKSSEPFEIRVWEKESNKEYTVEIEDWLVGDSHYTENGVSIAKNLDLDLPSANIGEDVTVNLFPNPTRGENSLRITIPEEANISIDLLTLDGKTVKQLVKTSKVDKGNYLYRFNHNNLVPGYYLYKIQTNNNILLEKLMIIK